MSNFDVIEHFSSQGDLAGLHRVMSGFFLQTERNTDPAKVKSQLSHEVNQKGAGLTCTTRYKLQHDLEQAIYLAKTLKNATMASYFEKSVAPIYQKVLETVPPDEELINGMYFFQPHDYQIGIASVYNKALHLTDFSSEGPLLNPDLDSNSIQHGWRHGTTPGITIIDNLLFPSTLDKAKSNHVGEHLLVRNQDIQQRRLCGSILG
jgi:hypothetical protein